MVTDIEPIDLTGPRSTAPATTVRSPRPRWPLLAIVAVLVAAGVWRLASADRAGRSPATSVPTTTTPAPATTEPAPTTAVAAPSAAPLARTVTFDPPARAPAGAVTLATAGDEVRLWTVDLAAGRAVRLDLPLVAGQVVADVRFFGADRAVARLEDGNYAALRIGPDGVEPTAVTDIDTRRSFGLAAVTRDGTAAWVAIDSALLRWDLASDSVDERWIDLQGDQLSTPEVLGVVGTGAVARAGGRTFLVSGDGARPLDVEGEVVAVAGDWVVARRCDDALRCGDLAATEVGSGSTVRLPSDHQFRNTCGEAAPGADGELLIVTQRGPSISLVTVTPEGGTASTDVHPIGLRCSGVAPAGDGVLIAHHWGLLLAGDGPPERVDMPALASDRPIIAVGTD